MQQLTPGMETPHMKMRRQFVAPQLVEEARLATLTLGNIIVSGRSST